MKKSTIIAVIIIAVQFVLLLSSSWNDSAVMDELAHIPAGYSYVAKMDYRLNPEHPPLIKDIAGIPLLFLSPNFPQDVNSWKKDINGQWEQGTKFLYESGNDAGRIIFWARLPVMLLAVLMAGLLFFYVRKRYNEKTALFSLALFAFSPTILAHSRYVTTDLGASFGFFIGILGLVYFLEKETWRASVIAGLLFGVAELLKFSLILLLPIYLFIIFVWLLVQKSNCRGFLPSLYYLSQTILKTLTIFAAGGIVIYAVYSFHTVNYPASSREPNGKIWTTEELTKINKLPDSERWQKITQIPMSQKRDTIFILSSFAGGPDPEGKTCNTAAKVDLKRRLRCLAEFTIWASDKPLFRPLAQYLLGLEMVMQRSAGGNNAYFMGEVSAGGWTSYFPLLYALKEPLAMHILTAAAFIFALWRVLKAEKGRSNFRRWLKNNIFEFSSIFFILFYWAYSMKSPLNIGIRHVMPTLPFIYILVSKEIYRWLNFREDASPSTWWEWFVAIYKKYIASIPKHIFVYVLFFWLIADTMIAFPAYLSYFNETVNFLNSAPASGLGISSAINNGYLVAVDSNYDWGQDLWRLKKYADAHRIQKIAIEYFGGGSLSYYFGNKAEGWWSAKGQPHGYFAISATLRQGAFGKPIAGFEKKPEDSYEWLLPFRPIDRAGESIFIYKLP